MGRRYEAREKTGPGPLGKKTDDVANVVALKRHERISLTVIWQTLRFNTMYFRLLCLNKKSPLKNMGLNTALESRCAQ